MNETKASHDQTSRRSLLKGMSIAAGAASLGAVVRPNQAAAQATKLTHAVAKYQDQPHDGQECSTCVQFEPPGSCKIVESPISTHGWCQFYTKKT